MTHPLSLRIAVVGCAALLLVVPVAGAQALSSAEGDTFVAPSYPNRTLPGQAAPAGNGGAGPNATRTDRAGTSQGTAPRGALRSGEDRQGTTGADGSERPFVRNEPPKPTEFQRFVEAATGRLLPIFGAEFFVAAQSANQPLDNVPVSADYTIGPGDEVMTRAWGSIDIDYRSTVDRNGMLNLPRIGSFNVAGVKAADLERNLRQQIGRLYTNFQLSVSLGQLRGLRVFVVGPAQRPGVQTLSSQSTLLSAVVAAGGPGPNGSMRKVQLRRDGRVISELDVYEFLVQGDKSRDVQLAAGDVVVFTPAGPRVAVTGAIDTPAIYELRAAEEPLGAVLRYAGGQAIVANPNRVQLERIEPGRRNAARLVENVALDAAGRAKALRDGDVLTLLEISPAFANAVTLKGHVAQPLRYPWSQGMRIRDLIPDREALVSADFYRRKNVLVQMVDDPEAAMARRDTRDARDVRETRDARDSRDGRDLREPRDGRETRDLRTAPTRDGRETRDMRDVRRPTTAEEIRQARLRGERVVADPGIARPITAPLFDDIHWEYATIERLRADLTTEVLSFDLGAVILRNDERQNLALLPGDVVTIYGQRDIRGPTGRQTRLVSVEGEVNSPGVYQLQAGETLKQLLGRAGGFTAQAYVYGLEFSREETRVKQRENLSQAIDRLHVLATTQAARDAANRRDDPTGAASSANVSNAATQAQLARLSRAEPSGRIALELTPTVTSIDALPDLPLEQGDRIIVPPRPGFVTVAGAVVNANAFIWKPGRTAGDYLRLAGTDEAADASNMFILRADGTVNHAQDRRGFFGRRNLESQVMEPGDALIVPNQLDFETWGRALVRNLKDFSQIFAQFGLGVAAINSIRN
jgi:protein involved in polysaccharide export with SLBB domain